MSSNPSEADPRHPYGHWLVSPRQPAAGFSGSSLFSTVNFVAQEAGRALQQVLVAPVTQQCSLKVSKAKHKEKSWITKSYWQGWQEKDPKTSNVKLHPPAQVGLHCLFLAGSLRRSSLHSLSPCGKSSHRTLSPNLIHRLGIIAATEARDAKHTCCVHTSPQQQDSPVGG